MTQTQENELKRLRDAFTTADKDGDDLLNGAEFTEFVAIAYHKQCPPEMYQTICARFKRDISKGIDWNTTKTIYVQANTNNHPKIKSKESANANANANTNTKDSNNETSHSKTNSNNSDSSHFIRQHSITMSQSSVISELERDREERSGSINTPTTSGPYTPHDIRPRRSQLQRASTHSSSTLHQTHRKSRSSLHSNHNSLSFEGNVTVGDTSSMIVDILDHKNKSLQTKLMKERTKRKKTEEIAQSLLKQNEEYKSAIEGLESVSGALQSDNERLTIRVETLERKVDEDRNAMKYLQEERRRMKAEVDEAYNLWSKLEKEHAAIVKKVKLKHKAEMEKLYAGFLESLGIDREHGGACDVTTVIATLKSNNVELKNTVDTLAESLARKQQSLLEALQAVDNIASNDEKTHHELLQYKSSMDDATTTLQLKGDGKIRKTLKQWNERRKSIKISRKFSDGLQGMYKRSNIKLSSEDREKSASELASESGLNAALFKTVNTAETSITEELNVDNAKHVVEMQFLSQQLSRDVANKTQSIENLEIANTVLFEQMEKMKQQMDEMKQLKQDYDIDRQKETINNNNND